MSESTVYRILRREGGGNYSPLGPEMGLASPERVYAESFRFLDEAKPFLEGLGLSTAFAKVEHAENTKVHCDSPVNAVCGSLPPVRTGKRTPLSVAVARGSQHVRICLGVEATDLQGRRISLEATRPRRFR